MDIVSKLLEQFSSSKTDPFIKTASKKEASPLSHFGQAREDHPYVYDNSQKKPEVVKNVPENDIVEKKATLLDIVEAPNMYEHLHNRWNVIASITGVKNPEAAFKNFEGYSTLTDRGRCALAYTKEKDSFVNEWHSQLMGKTALDENMDEKDAFKKLMRMISNDVRMRIKFEFSDPFHEEYSSSEKKAIFDEIEKFGSPDDKWLSETYQKKYALKKTADSINDEHNTQTHDSYLESIGDEVDQKDINNHIHGSPLDNNRSVVDRRLDTSETPPVSAPDTGLLFDTIQRADPSREEPLNQDRRDFEGLNASKKSQFSMQTPVDPNCSAVIDFQNRAKQDPNAPVEQIMQGFEKNHAQTCEQCKQYGLNNIQVTEAKKKLIASMGKTSQQWEYFHNALNRLKELNGKPMLRKVFDEGYYPILQDMVARGFAEFKKIKVTGTTSQIVMTPKGKLALTAVEEKMNMQKTNEPTTVSPTSQGEDLPGKDTEEADQNAPTEEIPIIMPVASKKTYSIADMEEFAPHIAKEMAKMGIMFVDKNGFDKKYASYIKKVSHVPEMNRKAMEKKAAELEISPSSYRKILYAHDGLKVFSHDEFVTKAGTTKAKLYKYKEAGTPVSIGSDNYIVAKITDSEIFLRKAQVGYDSASELKNYDTEIPENAYRNNKLAKFTVYVKKENGEKGKDLGYCRSHKESRLLGLAEGEGHYIVEVTNEKIGPASSNTGSPEIYGVYEYEVRPMPSGGAHATDSDQLMVTNYHQLNTEDPATHESLVVKKDASKKAQKMDKMFTVYPPDVANANEVADWAFEFADMYGFESDENSITDQTIQIWSRDGNDAKLQQRLEQAGIDFSSTDMIPDVEEALTDNPEEGMQIESKLTKTGESALKALYKACERVARDVSDGSRMFSSPEERKTVRTILEFIDNNLPALAKIAGVSAQEEKKTEQVIEDAKQEVEASPTEKASDTAPVVNEQKNENQVEEKNETVNS